MQNNSVWGRACGLTRTVVEDVRFDETQSTRLSSRRVRTPGRGVGVAGVVAAHRAMTRGRAGDAGVASMRAPPKCLSRPTLHGSGVGCMVRPSPRCRGRDTA